MLPCMPCLHAGFLPTLEKFGKTCHLLLGPDDVHFIQTSVNTDGSHVSARFAVVSTAVVQANSVWQLHDSGVVLMTWQVEASNPSLHLNDVFLVSYTKCCV